MKIWCFEKYYKNMAGLFNSTLKICHQSTGLRGIRIERRLLENFTFYKFIASLAIVITIVYMFYPVKSFLIDGELVPFVPIEIMFIDQSTLLGYFIAGIMMVVMGLYAVFGTEFMGLTFVYLIANYSPQADILEIDIDELNELWDDTSTSTLAYRHMFLRNICRKCIDMREYSLNIQILSVN